MGLSVTNRHHRLAGVVILELIGAMLLAVQIHNIWDDVMFRGEGLTTALLEFAFPGALTFLFMFAGWWLWRSQVRGPHVLRIAQWSGGAILGALALLAWALGIQLFVSNGTELYILLANSALIAAVGGGCVGVYSVQQSRQQAKLEESEERYRSLTEDVLDSSDVGLFIVDAIDRVVWLNQAAEHYFDIDRDTIVGTDARALTTNTLQNRFASPDQFRERVLASHEDGSGERFECHVLPGENREERWLEYRSQPIESGLYEGGRIEHYSDITERKCTTKVLEQRETLLRELHDVFLDPGRTFDQEVTELLELGQQAIDVDHALLTRFTDDGYEVEVTAGDGETFTEGERLTPGDTYCELVETTGETCEFENVAEDHPELTNRAWHDDHGIEYYIGIPVFVQNSLYGTLCFLDTEGRHGDGWEVTVFRIMANWIGYELGQDRRKRELENERQRLEFINRLIRHNLLNNLNVVMARVDFLDDEFDEEADTHMDIIQNRLVEMTNLIDTMRSFMRVIIDDEDHELQPVALDSVLRDEIAKAETDHPDATFEYPDPPAVQVVADELLPELFVNLLDNAVEHNDKADPRVAVDMDVGAETVTVEIADNGPGISEDVRETMFEKGQKRYDSPGTGFGLYLVKELVETYGGTIDVSDNDPEGTVFTITFDRPDPAQKDENGGLDPTAPDNRLST